MIRTALRFVTLIPRFIRQMYRDFGVHLTICGNYTQPIWFRVLNQVRLLANCGITAQEYYIQELWKPNLTLAKRYEYLGEIGSYDWQVAISARNYMALMDDKLLFDIMVRTAGIKTAPTLAVYSPTAPNLHYPVLRDWPELKKWLLDGRENLFIKPLHGITGFGVLSIGTRLPSEAPSWEQLPFRQKLSIGAVEQHFRTYGKCEFIIQKRLTPSRDTAVFSEDILQTVRIMTLMRGNIALVVAAALKIGSGKSAVDNLLRGQNLIAPVNLDNGKLGLGIEVVKGCPVKHSRHPISGAVIQGARIRGWNEIKELAERSAVLFPWFKSVGWDIALTADGPLVLEGNYWANVMLIQVAHQKGILSWPEYKSTFFENGLNRRVGIGLMRNSLLEVRE